MRKRRLGRTGLEVSEIGFGCGAVAGLFTREAPALQRQAVARALELDINYFDTAPVYGNTASEANLGAVLHEMRAQLPPEVTLATKVALAFDELDDIYGAVIRSVEGSLRRLRRERIDLIQLHNRVGAERALRPDIGSGAQLSLQDILGSRGVVDAFCALHAQGKVGYFGCCAFGGDALLVRDMIDSAVFDTVLVHYSLSNRSAWETPPDASVRDYGLAGARAAGNGMATIAVRVLEAGALAQGSSATLPPVEAAIRFALSNPEVSTALVGFSDIGQIEEAVRCAGLGPLCAGEIASL